MLFANNIKIFLSYYGEHEENKKPNGKINCIL